jgi:hypothetical protein
VLGCTQKVFGRQEMIDFHVFLSYARADNIARSPDGQGWVTAFHERLLAQHQRYSGRPLKVFFDRAEIRDNEDWERRIYRGLRTSSLLIAFVSPNYLRSPWCRASGRSTCAWSTRWPAATTASRRSTS